QYPQLAERRSVKKIYKIALLALQGTGRSRKILMKIRDVKAAKREEGRLGGLWQFPEKECVSASGVKKNAAVYAKKIFGAQANIEESITPVLHQSTQYRIRIFRFTVQDAKKIGTWKWVSLKDLEKIPLAKAERLLLEGL